jgi:Rad3-related DNA helicase
MMQLQLEQPSLYNVPHQTWRPHQWETTQWALNLKDTGICEQPTGSGKSCVAKAVSSCKSVTVLVKTKFLQEQYGREYSGDLLFGKANYLCSHPDARGGATCGECLFAEEGMYKCPHQCAYLTAKAKAAASPFAILNYAYWMTSRGFREKHAPQTLVLDEAHSVPDEVASFCGTTLTEKHRLNWHLPDFPRITAGDKGMFVNTDNDPVADAIGWLEAARTKLGEHYTRLKREAKGDTDAARKARKRFTRCERLGHKLRTTLDALKSAPDDWFIRSGKSALQFGKDKRPGFVAKPLTARHHFKDYFLDGYTTLMMSATIGDARTFAAECGIREYDSRVVPHRFAPERHPVYVLDAPKMGFKKKESSKERVARFDKQADVIAKFINQWPTDWPGLIHVSRITEERFLAQRLWQRGLEGRVWYIASHQEGYMPTNAQLNAWQAYKRRVPNAILVISTFSMGYDGLDEKINITAKIPFRRWGSEGSFERAWALYNRKRYDLTAALHLAQQQGRNRRGRECDYDTATEARGANAIADGSFSRVRSKLPLSVQESLVEG